MDRVGSEAAGGLHDGEDGAGAVEVVGYVVEDHCGGDEEQFDDDGGDERCCRGYFEAQEQDGSVAGYQYEGSMMEKKRQMKAQAGGDG